MLVHPLEREVLEPNQRAANPLRTFLAPERLKEDGESAIQEFLEIADGVEKGIVEHGDHRGRRMDPSGHSGSSCVRKG